MSQALPDTPTEDLPLPVCGVGEVWGGSSHLLSSRQVLKELSLGKSVPVLQPFVVV